MNFHMKLSLSLAFLLLLTAQVASAGNGEISPEEIAGATKIDALTARKLFNEGVIFIDVRKDKDWDAGRIPDAEHLDLKTIFTEENLKALTPPEDPLVLYCNGVECLRSWKATALAVSWGYTKVYYFRLGYPSWRKAGNPRE